MSVQTPRWETCPSCGEKRDTSGRYTSPANRRKDNEDWQREHVSGACIVALSRADALALLEVLRGTRSGLQDSAVAMRWGREKKRLMDRLIDLTHPAP